MDVSRKGIVVSVGFILAAVFLLYDSYTTKEVYLNEGALYPMTYPRILLGIWIVLSGLHVFARRVAVDIPSLLKALPTILLITAVLVGFTILLPLLGFPVASFLLLCAVFLILHYRYPIRLTLIARRGILLPLVHLPKADRPPASLRDVALFLISAFPTPKRREDAQWLILFSPPFRCPLMPKRCSSCSSELFTEPSSARCRGSAPS